MIDILNFESDVTMEFRLTALIVVVVNSIISYLFERIIVWQISICWKNREDRKIFRNQQREIEEQQKMFALPEQEQYMPSKPVKAADKQDLSPPEGEKAKKRHQAPPRKSDKDPKQKLEDHGGVRIGHEETKEDNQHNNHEHHLIMRQGGE